MAGPTEDAHPERRPFAVRALLFLLIAPGAVAPFVPFAFEVVPVRLLLASSWEWQVRCLASASLLGLFLTFAQARALLGWGAPRVESTVHAIAALSAAACLLAWWGRTLVDLCDAVFESREPVDAIARTLIGMVAIAVGPACALLWSWRWRSRREAAAEVAGCLVYAGFGIHVLSLFYDPHLGPGWYLIAVATLGSCVALALLAREAHTLHQAEAGGGRGAVRAASP